MVVSVSRGVSDYADRILGVGVLFAASNHSKLLQMITVLTKGGELHPLVFCYQSHRSGNMRL